MSRRYEAKLSPTELKRLFAYDQQLGRLIWRERPMTDFVSSHVGKIWNIRFAGKPAGIQGARMQLSIGDQRFKLHRVVWAFFNGIWPTGDIDHIDGDPQNNRIENLRDVPHSENQKNLRLSKSNTSGVAGVSFLARTGRWKASISVNSKTVHIGYYATKEEAVAARKVAEKENGYHPNHGRAA